MSKFQDILKDRMFVRYGVFIIFTTTLLYIIYLVLTHINEIISTLGAGIGSVTSALSPLIIGLILAYIINPLVTIVENKVAKKVIRIPSHPEKAEKTIRRTRVLSVLLTYIFLIGILVLCLYFLATLLLGKLVFNVSLPQLYNDISAYLVSYESSIRDWVSNLPQGMFTEQINNLVQKVIKWITDNFSAEAAMGLIGGVGVSVVNFIIGIMVSIYLSIDKDFFIRLWGNAMTLMLPEKGCFALDRTLKEINQVTSKFLRGVLLDALIVAMLSSIGLLIAGQQFALFLGVFAGLCNIIPYFGPIIGMVPAFIIGVFTDGIWQGLLAIVVLFIVQQLDATLIYPRVVGAATGIHPLFVLIAVSVGGYYFGLVGMILAVPTAGILQIFIHRWIAWKKGTDTHVADSVPPGESV